MNIIVKGIKKIIVNVLIIAIIIFFYVSIISLVFIREHISDDEKENSNNVYTQQLREYLRKENAVKKVSYSEKIKEIKMVYELRDKYLYKKKKGEE